MSTVVRLIKLSCEQTEDEATDEIYINWNGERLAEREINTGETVIIEEYRPIAGEALVDLQEYDWPDDDDFLERIIIQESEADQGEKYQTINGDGAS
ncbi:hypothetical protein [Streptomyces sp. c-19]|uniref:hypothetical protein n=1 Tax=Streptomyces sp. c-19 TaxID=2789275 RepID=UPI00398163E6